MNVKVNLLPEAKLHKLKSQAKRRQYATIAGLTGGIAAALIIVFVMLQVFLVSTYAINENRMKDLDREIANSKEMEQKSATLQENLAAFYQQNNDRTYASRIFTNLANATPPTITINDFEISEEDLVTITGSANSFAEVAAFAKALEEYNVNYKPQPGLDREPVFTEVKINSVNKDENSNKVDFDISFKANKELLKKQSENK